MPHDVVLGIDGGGTKTQAALVDRQGRLLGVGYGGPSNYHDIGVAAAQANLQAAVQAARRAANLPEGPFSAAFLGIGSTVVERDREAVRGMALALELAPPQRIGVDHDARIALAGGLSGRPGSVLIVGTGSSCFGYNASGQSWLAGGWGPLISDEGSGYWLGIQAMRTAAAVADGRLPASLLHEKVRDYLGLGALRELMHRLYVEGLSRSEIAAMSRLVLAAAQEGDPAAQRVLRQGAEHLAELVQTVADALGFTGELAELVTVGGLTKAGAIVTQPLADAIHARLPEMHITQPEQSPVLGACLLALRLLPDQKIE